MFTPKTVMDTKLFILEPPQFFGYCVVIDIDGVAFAFDGVCRYYRFPCILLQLLLRLGFVCIHKCILRGWLLFFLSE